MTRAILRRQSFVAGLTALVAGCSSTDTINAPGGTTVYRVQVNNETFRLALKSDAQIAQAEAMLKSGGPHNIHGFLVRGDGGFNTPYSWHLEPSTVTFPDVSIEACDGRPKSDVEADTAYWFGTLHVYCPWGARIVAREN